MTIRHEADGTYCFSFGGMCWDRFPSLEAAQEALYDLQHGRTPHSGLFTELVGWIDQRLAEDEQLAPTTPAKTPTACQPDINSIPDAVGAITYPSMLRICAALRALELPQPLVDDILDPIALELDYLPSPATVAALTAAWMGQLAE